ncbi:hypothetical protein UPYG_G00327480 [Umbra pygmaea]|uniref:IRF tryptophan pentad repeat domain-containing protein n=1 Tax=Umbra pygmaea TaxID=75934 RepID=A0ABD0W1G9_UMBPY
MQRVKEMHQGRLRMRPWLEEQIQSGKYPGVIWLDKTAQVFQIPWKHAARHGWNIDKDATLFRNWAMHTGKYKPGIDKPDPKTWKANFRCALNSLADVKELQDKSIKKGTNAFRVYMMMPSIKSTKQRRGLQESDLKQNQISISETENVSCAPLDRFAEVFLKYRSGQESLTPGIFHVKDNHPTYTSIKEEWPAQTYSHPSSFPTSVHENSEITINDKEQAEAVCKIVDNLKTMDHWSQSNENRGWRLPAPGWVDGYCEDTDFLGYPLQADPLQADCYTHCSVQRPFL